MKKSHIFTFCPSRGEFHLKKPRGMVCIAGCTSNGKCHCRIWFDPFLTSLFHQFLTGVDFTFCSTVFFSFVQEKKVSKSAMKIPRESRSDWEDRFARSEMEQWNVEHSTWNTPRGTSRGRSTQRGKWPRELNHNEGGKDGSERHLGNCDLELKDAREQMRFSSSSLLLLSPDWRGQDCPSKWAFF